MKPLKLQVLTTTKTTGSRETLSFVVVVVLLFVNNHRAIFTAKTVKQFFSADINSILFCKFIKLFCIYKHKMAPLLNSMKTRGMRVENGDSGVLDLLHPLFLFCFNQSVSIFFLKRICNIYEIVWLPLIYVV